MLLLSSLLITVCTDFYAASVDINVCDNYNRTPLLVALQNHHHDIAALLLEKGGDAKVLDSAGRTALHYAAEGSDDQMVKNPTTIY